jgi:hypothetical protein
VPCQNRGSRALPATPPGRPPTACPAKTEGAAPCQSRPLADQPPRDLLSMRNSKKPRSLGSINSTQRSSKRGGKRRKKNEPGRENEPNKREPLVNPN